MTDLHEPYSDDPDSSEMVAVLGEAKEYGLPERAFALGFCLASLRPAQDPDKLLRAVTHLNNLLEGAIGKQDHERMLRPWAQTITRELTRLDPNGKMDDEPSRLRDRILGAFRLLRVLGGRGQ